jgi:hypothetical protein
MESIEINNNQITYRSNTYELVECAYVDEQCVHLFLGEGIYAITLPCIINTQVINTLDEFKNAIK